MILISAMPFSRIKKRPLILVVVSLFLLFSIGLATAYLYRIQIATSFISRKIQGLTGVPCKATIGRLSGVQADLLLQFPEQELTVGPLGIEWELTSVWKRSGVVKFSLQSDGTKAREFSIGKHQVNGSVTLDGLSPTAIDVKAQADWIAQSENRLEGPRLQVQLDASHSAALFSMLLAKKQAVTATYSGTPLANLEDLSGVGPLQLVLPQGKVSTQLKWSLDLDSNKFETDFTQGMFAGFGELVEFSGHFGWNPPDWDVRVESQIPGDRSKSAAWNPLRLALDGRGKYPQIQGQGKLKDLVGDELLPFRFDANADTSKANIAVNKEWDLTKPFVLSRFSRQIPAIVFKQGKLRLVADGSFSPKPGVKARGAVTFTDVSATVQEIPIVGFNASCEATSLFPLKIKPFQVRAARAGNKSPVEALDAEVSIQGDSLAVIPKVAKWAGGQVTIHPFDINFKKLDIKTDISLDALDLQTLLAGADFGYISAKGKVSGKVPLNYRGGYLEIVGASLVSENGWLRYADAGMKLSGDIDTMQQFQQLLAKGQQALVMKALDNFEYKKLEADIDRTKAKGLGAKLKIYGRNPDLARGQPFEFNISIAGQLEQMVKRSFFLMSGDQ